MRIECATTPLGIPCGYYCENEYSWGKHLKQHPDHTAKLWLPDWATEVVIMRQTGLRVTNLVKVQKKDGKTDLLSSTVTVHNLEQDIDKAIQAKKAADLAEAKALVESAEKKEGIAE